MLIACAALIVLTWFAGSRTSLHYHWGIATYSEGEASSIDDVLLSFGAFFLATLCSATYWSLVARSVIGGIVLNGGFQLLTGLCVALIAQRLFKSDNAWRVIVCASPFYSIAFLLFGRRKFMRLQVTSAFGTEYNRTDFLVALRFDVPWLRATRRSELLNLFRNELRLNRPLFLIAAFFVVAWALGSLVFKAAHVDKTIADSITVGIASVYVCTIFAFAGCVSLGEDKSLGTHASQLTLPVRKEKLWGAKLSVAVTLCLALGVLLPAILLTTPAEATKDSTRIALIAFGCISLTLVGFWSATHFQNSITAVLATVLFLPGMGFAAMLGDFLVNDSSGFQARWLEWMCLHFHLSPDYFLSHSDLIVILLPPAIVCAVLLRQSIRRFSMVQQNRALVVRDAIVLFFLTICLSAWVNDFIISNNRLRMGMVLQEKTERAFSRAIPKIEVARALDDGHEVEVPLNHLIATGELPESSAEWLRGSKIKIRRSYYYGPKEFPRSAYQVEVRFPHEPNDWLAKLIPDQVGAQKKTSP
jgi:hypothetical protein